MIKNDFENLGYSVDVKLLNARDYGVPKQLERVIILGNRLGVKNIFHKITHVGIYPGEENYTKKILNI